MRNLKYLMVIMMIFALVVSACSSDGGQTGNEAVTPMVTDATGLGAGANDNLNGNLNGNDSGLTNGNENAAGALATSTPASKATPLGTAMGTPAATEEIAATEAMDTMTTETPAAGLDTTPMATDGVMATEDAMATAEPVAGEMMTYENGILLSHLIGAGIEDAAGNDWGTVDSAILDQATCSVPYLLVRVNGDMVGGDPAADATVVPGATNTNGNGTDATNANDNGAGAANANDNAAGDATSTEAPGMGGNLGADGEGDLVMLPLSALYAEGQQGVLNLPLTVTDQVAQLVTTAPRYTEDTLPDWATPGWDADLNTVWTGYPTMTGGATGDPAMTGTGAVRLTDVTDLNVTNSNDEDLGDIEDVVVMLNNQPAYVFLAVGGILDLGESLIPVPCDQVTWQMDENGGLSVVINADQTMIEGAPTIDEIPALFDAGWDTDYAAYWAGATPGVAPAATTDPAAAPPAVTPTP